MKLFEKLNFKIPYTILQFLRMFFIHIDHKFLPDIVWRILEDKILEIGSDLALLRIKAFPKMPYTNKYSVHTLLRHQDVHRYIINIQSLLRFSQKYPKLIIYDDGTLTNKDYELLHGVPRILVISQQWANQHFYSFYRDNPILAYYRDNITITRKITDLAFLIDSSKKTMILDSDVGFLRNPTEVFEFLEESSSPPHIIYMLDIYDAYIIDSSSLKKIVANNVKPMVNSGLVCFTTKLFTKNFVEKSFALIYRSESQYPYTFLWLEQTMFAIFASLFDSKKLSKSYFIGYDNTPPDSICRHYVNKTKYFLIKDILQLLKNY